MAVDHTIPQNGKYTMTNLSAATGIGSYNLSDHHPNQTNAETSFGDFVLKAIGRDKRAGNSPPVYSRFVGVVSIENDPSKVDYPNSGYNSNDEWEFDSSTTKLRPGTYFTVRFELSNWLTQLGEFAAKALIKNGAFTTDFIDNGNNSNSNAATLHDVTIDGSSPPEYIDYQYELLDYTKPFVMAWTFPGHMNTNADNAGTSNSVSQYLPSGDAGLMLRTIDIEKPVPLIDRWHVQVTYNSVFGEEDEYLFNFNNPSLGDSTYSIINPNRYIDPTFEFYEDDTPGGISPNTPYATQFDDPEALSGSYAEQVIGVTEPEVASGSTKDWYFTLVDQWGNPRDTVHVPVTNGGGFDPFPSQDGNTETYIGETSSARSRGTKASPFTMTMNDLP
jgi:hypothetical protein